jgi:predicted amidohydrolase YtcJ
VDLLLYNATVRTITHGQASALAIRGNKILAAGDSETLLREATSSTRKTDLGGRTVIPGFNDAHAHIWKMGHLLTTMLDLRGLTSFAALRSELQKRDRNLAEGAWLLGRGLNETQFDERRLPSRTDLDLAVPHRPVVLTRTCGHIYAANSLALERAGIGAETDAPAGGVIGRDEAGQPNGLLYESAMELITRVQPPPSEAEYRAMITAATKHQLRLGITSTSDCGVGPELLSVYSRMDAEGLLPSRINVMPLRTRAPLPEKYTGERLHVDTVKFLADGGLSGATAALSIPYRHTHSRGVLRIEQEELLELCREPYEHGWRIATHAIGDVTIDSVLSVYERLVQLPHSAQRPRCGLRIEHLGLPSAQQLRRAAALGVLAAPQAIFLRELGANFRAFVPDALSQQIYPIRAMLDAGIIVALSSDAPVVADDNPLSGMEAAITRKDGHGEPILSGQAITAEEALYAYTMAGAICTGDEQLQGSLSAGMRADIAVLSADPLTIPAEQLRSVQVDMTLLDGSMVYER